MGLDTTHYAARRRRLAERMVDGVAVIPTAPERLRNRDTHYPYRHDSYFHYLTGFDEPEAVLVLEVRAGVPTANLFCRPKDAEREIWDGFRHGPEAACEVFGLDAAWPIGELDARLPEILADRPRLLYAFGHDPTWDGCIARALEAVRQLARSGRTTPEAIVDVRAWLDRLRVTKDASEIDTMRRAAEISGRAHRRAMRSVRAGMWEYELEAELLYEFRRHGAQSPAYPSIVAGGASACVLHYVSNDRQLADGDLVLIDAGCELDGYASDITRTFPVNGRFSVAQREIYELVLAAQAAAVAAVAPGRHFNEPHEAAVRVLCQGLSDLGLLSGSVDDMIAEERYKRFYMHRTSHWLGRDVHDAGPYRVGETWPVLAPGQVLTVEPGCYIRAAGDIPEKYWHIGVRIEDDALVTEAGCELITAATPKTVAEIEAWMAGRA
ncbi:MAG: Xaa-Pro aminopeptidase [Rhodocyclaceae bacterium]|nr:aminopeptidase P N-terminal domain-containing protein [Rhodocyclaceae bacterium]MCG3186992.1 Xaa-Pro aminopeptidase [Rhodocyclaceae bacterium]